MIVEGGRVKSERSFFQFPSDRAKLILWCSLIKRQHGTENNAISKSSVVCDLHFESTSVKRTPFGKRKMLLPNALPTLHAWNNWVMTDYRPKVQSLHVLIIRIHFSQLALT